MLIQNTPRLGPDDRFTFHCDPTLDCFGHCCQDVSILLTPYDVLRMKKALGISSSEFMEQYTSIAYSAEKRVPVVFLKMNEDDKKCQFVSEKGCGVYANRPWACRMYPLGMAERATSQAAAERFYFVLKEELCHGHGKGGEMRGSRVHRRPGSRALRRYAIAVSPAAGGGRGAEGSAD